jgi:hypothetical protein
MSGPVWTTRRDMLARVRAMPRTFGKVKGWPRSKVVRRDPATYQQRPKDVGIRMCGNWTCKLWISSDAPRCPHCHERQAA